VHGDGEPLILVMGLGADKVAWALQVPALAERHRVVTYDNRDVGQSPRMDGSYEVADMAGDLLALADELGLDSFHLVGLSMGGAIAQRAALAAPERVRTLTLIVTFAYGGPWALARARLWREILPLLSAEQRTDLLMHQVHSQSFFENTQFFEIVRNAILQNPHPQEVEAFVRQLDASSRHDAREELRGLDLPVLVVGAEHDLMVPVWKAREVAELIPGARYEVFERAGHAVNLERAEELNELILDFVAEHS
jgi:pimeloyl-ACP methyl ester carboxylesterase